MNVQRKAAQSHDRYSLQLLPDTSRYQPEAGIPSPSPSDVGDDTWTLG